MINNNKIFFLWSVISIIINLVYGYENDNTQLNNESGEDNYYMIFVNNGNSGGIIKKREETEALINEFVNEIQNLITENRGTYEDPIKLAEIESSARFRKRSTDNTNIPSLVYPVSTVDDSTILYAYLSGNLATKVGNLDYVEGVSPDSYTELATSYNIDDIKTETKWKDVGVREYTHMHLSLLSQGDFSLKHIGEYDYNYYYPSSAGQDVDIIIMDSGFNFNYTEFSNSEDRTTECKVYIKDGETIDITDGDCKTKDPYAKNHGESVADAAGGLDRGVANKANIRGIQLDVSVNTVKDIDIIGGLKYISDHLERPHQTVINLSFGKYFSYTNKTQELIHYEKLINEIASKGAMIFAAAGNRNSATVSELSEEAFYPCSFENVICVGGVDIMDPTVSNDYRKASDCNYGDNIDIYAPYDMDLLIPDDNGNEIEKSVEGTSFSAPLVAGVAATLISEHTDIEFDISTMLNFLTELGIKDVIKNVKKGKGNVFVNNGKHIVYSSNDVYYGCGVRAGNLGCNLNEFCSEEGFCSVLSSTPSESTILNTETIAIPSATTTSDIVEVTSVVTIPSSQSTIINDIVESTTIVPSATTTSDIVEVTSIVTIPSSQSTIINDIVESSIVVPSATTTSDIVEATSTVTIPSSQSTIINNIVENTIIIPSTTVISDVLSSTQTNEIPTPSVENNIPHEEEINTPVNVNDEEEEDTPIDVGDVEYDEEVDEDYIEEEYLDDEEEEEVIDLNLYLDDEGNELDDNNKTIRKKLDRFYKKYYKSQLKNLFHKFNY